MTTAKFIYDTADRCPDIYYASKFSAPDPFIYFETNGKKYLVMSDLEIDRARKNADVHKILSLSKYTELAAKKTEKPVLANVLDAIFSDFGITKLEVPPSAPFFLAEGLKKLKYKITAGSMPFYPERLQKNEVEKKNVARAQKEVFRAIGRAEDILRESKIRNDCLYFKGKMLTSEFIREEIHVQLMRKGYIAPEGSIVACGEDSTDPHNSGKGPLRPHRTIIVDLYPKSTETLFWGDATRTFCKGKAPEKLKEMYNAVKAGQEHALKNIRAGVNGRSIHEAILKIFENRGFKTGEFGGRMQGFFHSTGHGIGLELHEAPTRIGPVDMTLKEGMITSIEPGLYYKGIGGVRLEDLVYITKHGCEILSGYPKKLEIL